jgi:hypothetical protein
MIFGDSCEAERLAFDSLFMVAKAARSYLNKEFESSPLKNLPIEIFYTPIVMPEHLLKKYTERSRARIKEGIYYCSPQLDYPTFVGGTLKAQCAEYMRGIALSSPHLKKFSATPDQIADFDAIIAVAPTRLYREIRAAQNET